MGKWEHIRSDSWNHKKDLVTYHVHYNWGTIENCYLFPKGEIFMEDYQDRLYSTRRLGKKRKVA